MTPDEHYREAERLLDQAAQYKRHEDRLEVFIEAQVHATLATIYRSTERLVEK